MADREVIPVIDLRVGIIKKVARSIQIQRHSSSPTRLSGGFAKPIVDHAHEKSAKRQGERGAVRSNAIHEIKSPLILQSGPAALTARLAELQ